MSQKDFLAEYQEIIEKELPQYIPNKPFMENFYGAMHYALGSGGKRIRPALCIACCQALNGELKSALPYAVAVEIIHNFSLVHDDIEDQDSTRRNLPAVWKKYGLAHGVNIGDGMFALAFHALLKTNTDAETKIQLLEILVDAIIAIAEGQTMDLDFHNQKDVTESQYFDSVQRKTGYLLSAALRGGAIIAKAPSHILSGLEEYGRGIGMAFQIRDDIIDLTLGKGRGGEIGCDIKEGKRSLIVIHALSQASNIDREQILRILDTPREDTTVEDVSTVIELFKKYQSIEYSQETAKRLVEQAMKGLNSFPETPYKEYLIKFAKFIIQRND